MVEALGMGVEKVYAARGLYELEIEAWNGMDAVMRIVNIARRAKLRYTEMRTVFEPTGRLRLRLTGWGEGSEARWLAAKLERMPEVYRVEARLLRPDEDALPA